MKILVANLGSTSFKYRLFEKTEGAFSLLVKGGYERTSNYTACIEAMLEALVQDGFLRSGDELDAVGFKTVLGKDLSGCVPADENVLQALEGFASIAPAHNPAYAEGIRSFAQKMPSVPLVALFETAFYQWVSEAASTYAIPKAWRDAGVRRYGFHGASHKYVAERSAELCGREDIAERVRKLYQEGPGSFEGKPFRVISCHLGGSSSVTGIHNGVAIGTSMGFSPQSGLPQNNRVGDLDAMAIPFAQKELGLSLDEVEHQLTKESGLLGLSGVSNDLRDIRRAYGAGNADAELALHVLIDAIRHWIGAFLLKMGGCEAIVFTAGIGENDPIIRELVCTGLEELGLVLSFAANQKTIGGEEGSIQDSASRIQVLVLPANEELVIAREVARHLEYTQTTTSSI
jgi:acetate kinase